MKKILLGLLMVNGCLTAPDREEPTSFTYNHEIIKVDIQDDHIDHESRRLSYNDKDSMDQKERELRLIQRKLTIAIFTAIVGFMGNIVTFLSTYYGVRCE